MSENTQKSNDFHFDGFDIPESNYFKMPNEWTNITARIRSLAELKVVEYVLRHTWGYQEFGLSKKITTDEFMNGRKRRDGTRIDQGTGLSNRSVIDGLRRAVAHGLLIEEVNDADKARIKKYYTLRMKLTQREPQPDMKILHTEEEVDVKNLHTGEKILHNRSEQPSPRTEKDTLEKNNNNKTVVVAADTLLNELIKRGVTKKSAQQLASEYGEGHITEKIELLDYLVETKSPLVSRNPAGYLLKAIVEDYSPPKGFTTKAERMAEKAKEEHQQQEFEEKKRVAKEQEKARRDKIIDTYQISETLLATWEKTLTQLQLNVPKAPFERWFSNTFLLSVDDNVAIVGVESQDAKDWLQSRARAVVANPLTGILGEKITVRFEVLDVESTDE